MLGGAELLVVNSGPLIALARMDVLDLVGALSVEFVCPREVRLELDAGARQGYPKVEPRWLEVVDLRDPPTPLAVASIDMAEAAVIQLALERGVSRVCIDETRARRLASSVGLHVTGSLGLLLRAKLEGALPLLRPVIQRGLDSGIWYDRDLVRRILADAGEELPEGASSRSARTLREP